MTLFVLAGLTAATFIWALVAPRSPQELTTNEIAELVVLGFAS
jgi:hypothetical protein